MVAVEVREVRARHVQPDAVPLAEPYAGRAQPDSELGIGVWADRTRLRPILIITSMVRALSLASVPAAFALDLLLMEQLYAVALINGVCRTFTSVSFGAYLPKVVGRDNLVEANSKLAASGSVVETSAFSVGGWIAQLAGAIATVVTEALSSVLSALFFLAIRIPESEVSSNDKLQAGLTRICGWAQLPSASGGRGGCARGGLLYGKSLERQRFTIAHELGHMVLDIPFTVQEEKVSHRFAGAFLAPGDELRML